jgi:hypothetical protein
MIQCLAFGEGYVDYFDEGTVELATCGISEATNAVIAPGPQESRCDLPAQVVDFAWFFEDVASPDTFADRIYRSLQRTLRAFPEAEGRCVRTPESWQIKCCNHGVPFSRVLNFGLDLEQQRHRPAAGHLFDRVDGDRVLGGDEPLLRVKLTLFGARGYCLALSASRALCDAHGLLALFTRAWSSNERAAICPAPSHDRDCVPLSRAAPHDDVRRLVEALVPPPASIYGTLARSFFFGAPAPKVETLLRLSFSQADVERLKRDTVGGAVPRVSTNDVLVAHAAHVVALLLEGGIPGRDAGDALHCYCALDLRKYADDPRLANRAFCNAVASLRLASMPLPSGAAAAKALARDLRTTLESLSPDAARHLRAAYDRLPPGSAVQGPAMVCTNWLKLPANEVGFNGETAASYGLGLSYWRDAAEMMAKTAATRNVVAVCAFSRNCEDASGASIYADILLPTGGKDDSAIKVHSLADNARLHPLLRLKLAAGPAFIDVS